MLLLKILFHLQAAVLMMFYRLVYQFGGGGVDLQLKKMSLSAKASP